MTGLEAAVAALIDRKLALQGEARNGENMTDEQMALLSTGLDLDLNDLKLHGEAMGRGFLRFAIEQGAVDLPGLASLWADGVLTGLLLAELRHRQEAGS